MNYNYNYTYDTSATEVGTSTVNAATLGAIFLVVLVFVIASYAVGAFLLGRLYKKAGVPQWVAWVPIYNTWKLLQLGNQQGFWALFGIIPLLNLIVGAITVKSGFLTALTATLSTLSFLNIITGIFIYISMYEIGKKLGKKGWFVLLAIFVPIIWLIWLGFDDSKWPKSQKTTLAKKTAQKPA